MQFQLNLILGFAFST